MRPLVRLALVILLVSTLAACQKPTDTTPPDDSSGYEIVDCPVEEPPPPTPEQKTAFCEADHGAPLPGDLRHPPSLDDLAAKNAYDEEFRAWLRAFTYREAPFSWAADQEWRFTGPYAGEMGSGRSYGVHPAVRIWYSPEVAEWLCNDRQGDLADGALVIKEMASFSALDPFLKVEDGFMSLESPNSEGQTLEPSSWTIYLKNEIASWDGVYWANYTFTDSANDGNPPIEDASGAVGVAGSPGPGAQEPNPLWYPTGYVYNGTKIPDAVYPYNGYGNYCLNCHASAVSESTYSTINNILTVGLRYRQIGADQICRNDAEHVPSGEGPPHDLPHGLHDLADAAQARSTTLASQDDNPFPRPRATELPGWEEFYGPLAGTSFADVWPNRMPAETYDRRVSEASGPPEFLTSDQCTGCHDATYNNSRVPNMVFEETDGDTTTMVNLSPYGEWRASPMGLAGRDPIFFSQLESETNHLPDTLTACIENTCLHCHGVLGQRQLGIDTAEIFKGDDCEEIFGVEPPPGVKFGQPFRRAVAQRWPGDGGDPAELKYAALARDGISCTVCHRISETDLQTDAAFTGNWTPGPATEIFGPFEDVIPKPMENALGITPLHADQITSSEICGSCHNILLPVFTANGQAAVPDPVIKQPDGQPKQLYSYEQTTHLEWLNSDFGLPDSPAYESCQDCHMPHEYDGVKLAFKIANIEDSTYAQTDNRLPDADLDLRLRTDYRRHSLHGLNVFLNAFFEQFPLLLGIRQIDYMTGDAIRPPLITGRESMLAMARGETATVEISELSRADNQIEATVTVNNQVGHFFPSGVGFRRVLLELVVSDASGNPVWASGRTNDLGVVVEGLTENPLPSEMPWLESGSAQWQPHYQVIDAQNQAQIYQEVIIGTDQKVNTSFLRRDETVKDNRLRPTGFDPQRYTDPAFLEPFVDPNSDDALYIKRLADEGPNGDDPGYCESAGHDPDYCDPTKTGRDSLIYRITLADDTQGPFTVTATIYSQSIPPAYLHERFRDANVGAGRKMDIQRLYHLASHLDTAAEDLSGEAYLEDYKLEVASGSRTVE